MAEMAEEYAQEAVEDIEPTEADVAARAYQIWESRGRPAGSDRENWFQAERELKTTGPRVPGVVVS